MSLVLNKIRAYAKLTALVALAFVASLVFYKNRSYTVDVWFFRSFTAVNVLWLMFCTALGSIISWWIVMTSFSVWHDLREVHRAVELEQAAQRQNDLAKRLEEAEKRIDQKVKDSNGKDDKEP